MRCRVDAWRESISIILMNEMVKIGYLSELGTSRGDGRGTAWSLSAYAVPGQQAEASGAQRTLRAASRTVVVTSEDQPRKRPVDCRQLGCKKGVRLSSWGGGIALAMRS